MRIPPLSILIACLLVLGTARAQPNGVETVEVRGGRITLGDLGSSFPAELRQIDLGRAAPPGGSRLLSKAELERQIKAAGFRLDGSELPAAVRVRSAGKSWLPTELVSLVQAEVGRALPPGVKLTSLTTSTQLTLSPDVKVGTVTVPNLPKRVGAVRLSLVAELTLEGEVTHRVPFTASLVLSPQAAAFAVPQGSVVTLQIRRRCAVVSARAQALVNADIGDMGSFRIQRTGHVLKARVTSSSSADVVEGP